MSQLPRRYRKHLYEQKLSSVIKNPYADQSAVAAAKAAIEQKLSEDDRQYESSQRAKIAKYRRMLG